MQPLHPHPLPQRHEITESGAAAAIRACMAIPHGPACPGSSAQAAPL